MVQKRRSRRAVLRFSGIGLVGIGGCLASGDEEESSDRATPTTRTINTTRTTGTAAVSTTETLTATERPTATATKQPTEPSARSTRTSTDSTRTPTESITQSTQTTESTEQQTETPKPTSERTVGGAPIEGSPPYEMAPSYPNAMLTSPINERFNTTFYRGGRQIYRTGSDGELAEVAVLPRKFDGPDLVCGNAHNQWLVLTGSWGESGTALLYRSIADLEAGQAAASLGDVFPPFRSSIVPFLDQEHEEAGVVWPEYHLTENTDSVRIIRTSSANGFSIEPVFKRQTPDRRGYLHFHSIDHDPYEPRTMYATCGDPNPNPTMYRSHDYGRTWAAVPGASGTQDFRTLRINFGPEYLYWAMDGWDYETGDCRFYRASRDDPSAPEEIATIGTESERTLSYGSARTFEPNGVLVTTRTTEKERVPLYFYDIEADSFERIYEFSANYERHNIPGVAGTMPYQNQRTGTVSLYAFGVPNPEKESRVWIDFDPRILV